MDDKEGSFSRRDFVSTAAFAAGGLAALGASATSGAAHAAPGTSGKKGSTVPLSWDEVYFTNCPMVSANNIDQELGWCKTDFKHIGVDYSYFRSRRENDWYPHYIHNLDNLIRFGGAVSPDRSARGYSSHPASGCNDGLRRRLHDGAC